MCKKNTNKPYYITTAIAYASGKPHIGNTYEIVLADAIARFKRYEGFDVFFQTGTDEHGQKIEFKAKEANLSPKEFVDKNVAMIKDIWDLMNTSYDKFIRTTDEYHKKQVQKIFQKLYEQGDIYKGFYEGFYCTPCESFFTDSQVKEGKCPDCGRKLTNAKEEAYFFKMSKYAPRLIEYINTHPNFIRPESRKNEMMNNFLLPGLKDLCVSRTSFSWGIPVSFDKKHVTYVWLDALSNYITGLGFDIDGQNGELYKKYWPADLHLIGKDIIRFHTIYWPIFLMALNIELPKQVFGHPWLLQGDGKMSKSKGNVLYADTLVDFFGVDAVRYFVLHEIPFDNDGVISWELMIERYNCDLANILGNLVSRTISMANKYFDKKISKPELKLNDDDKNLDIDFENIINISIKNIQNKMDELRVSDAISELWNIFKRSNKYIDETMPWLLAKDESKKVRLELVLYNLIKAISIGATILESFMPKTSQEILSQFGLELIPMNDLLNFDNIISEINVCQTSNILFARLDKTEILKKVDKLFLNNVDNSDKKIDSDQKAMNIKNKPIIAYDDFSKLQLQIGKIIECKELENSKKLLCFKVKIGDSTKQILSGIKQWYKADEMLGKNVVVLANLEPRKIAGLISEGMILSAQDDENNLSLITCENDIKSGSEIS